MFENFDFDTLMETMLSNISDKFDKREGSVIYDAVAPVALELSNFYVSLDMVMDEIFADTASYYYLIKRAAERGIFPKEETYSICKMIVKPAETVIQSGDRFNLDELNYTVIGPIENENCMYKIQCETAGTIGNQQLGELIPIDYIENLESAELTEILIPGEDEEDVETFRERYFASFQSEAYGGNKADYIEKINKINGVGGCKIKRAWQESGYSPSSMKPAKEVETWLSSQSPITLGDEVYNWISKVFYAAKDGLLTTGGTVSVTIIDSNWEKPSDTLVETVQNALDPPLTSGEGNGVAPIGHVVTVKAVQEVVVNISTKLTFDTGYSFENLKEEIYAAVDGYFLGLAQSWADSSELIVRIAMLETVLLNVEGIIDISGTSINGIEENLVIDDEHIPVRGDVINE